MIQSGFKIKNVFFLIVSLLVFYWSKVNGQVYLPIEQVEKDFKSLLIRPLTNLKPFTKSFKTDSVLIEKGFFYSE